MGKTVQTKKEAKRQRLLDSAYELFLKKGAGATSIHEIAQNAQVAKGTFYLSFRNKEEVTQALMRRVSRRVLSQAWAALEENRQESLAENTIFLVDWIIEYFKRDTLVLRLLERNFSWPVIQAEIDSGQDPLYQALMKDLEQSPVLQGHSRQEVYKYIFAYLEMVGSVCYSSIIQHTPGEIDEMKPVLYDIIRRGLG